MRNWECRPLSKRHLGSRILNIGVPAPTPREREGGWEFLIPNSSFLIHATCLLSSATRFCTVRP